MKYLISPDKKQYKANLHCHSVLSDGKKTPQALKEMYKARGYAILAITDHERPHEHRALCDDEFLTITGYEAYIRPDEKCRFDAYAPEVHLNLFARDPMNVTMICMNECCCKYLTRDHALNEITALAGSERPREFTRAYINEFISTARDNGYLVAYNHPYWSMEGFSDILPLEGLFSIEMCNYSSYVTNGLEHNGALYDQLLGAGKCIFCHGSDDIHNDFEPDHPNCDSFGAFTMIMPEAFTYDGVIDAMERGEMYASMGPEIRSVAIEDGKIFIECSEAAHIYVYFGSKNPAWVHAQEGEALTGAVLAMDPHARYVRVSVCDAQGRWADTRGYSRMEAGLDPFE